MTSPSASDWEAFFGFRSETGAETATGAKNKQKVTMQKQDNQAIVHVSQQSTLVRECTHAYV